MRIIVTCLIFTRKDTKQMHQNERDVDENAETAYLRSWEFEMIVKLNTHLLNKMEGK